MQEPKNIGEYPPKTITRILAVIDRCTVDNKGLDTCAAMSSSSKLRYRNGYL